MVTDCPLTDTEGLDVFPIGATGGGEVVPLLFVVIKAGLVANLNVNHVPLMEVRLTPLLLPA